MLLHVLGLIALFGVCLLGVVSLVFGVPGTVIILLAAVVYAWATGFGVIRWSTLGWMALLAVVAEGLEFWAGAAAASRARPSRRVTVGAILGSFAGALMGAPFLLGIGALLGALLGAFAGAAAAVAAEGGTTSEAWLTGVAALRGRFLGFVLKSALAVAMVMLLAAALTW